MIKDYFFIEKVGVSNYLVKTKDGDIIEHGYKVTYKDNDEMHIQEDEFLKKYKKTRSIELVEDLKFDDDYKNMAIEEAVVLNMMAERLERRIRSNEITTEDESLLLIQQLSGLKYTLSVMIEKILKFA